jgi:hypothetical protein
MHVDINKEVVAQPMDSITQPMDSITQLLNSYGQPDDSYAPPMELSAQSMDSMELTAQSMDSIELTAQPLNDLGFSFTVPSLDLNLISQPMDLNFTNQLMDLNFSSQSMNSFSFTASASAEASATAQPLNNSSFTRTSQPLSIEANNSTTSSFTTFMDMLGPITKPQVRTKENTVNKKYINYLLLIYFIFCTGNVKCCQDCVFSEA